MFGKIKSDVVQSAVRWFAGGVFREIAEGKYGPTLQRAYLVSRGKKTEIGGMLALLVSAFLFYMPAEASKTVATPAFGSVSALLIVGGLIDKAWRTQPPPIWFMDGLHRIMSFGPVASACVAAAVQLLPLLPHCHHCEMAVVYIQLGSAAVASVTGWLAAYCAPPPDVPGRRASDSVPPPDDSIGQKAA